jgi:hypothetical protein
MLAGEPSLTTLIFEVATPSPETCIDLETVTLTVTEADCAMQTVPARTSVVTMIKQITRIPARRRILTTYTTNQPTFSFGSRGRRPISPSGEREAGHRVKECAQPVAQKVTLKYQSRSPE